MIKLFRTALTGGVVVSLAALAPALPAQQPSLTPTALGQITDQVLQALSPQDGMLSRVPVGKRKIVFDFQRTLAAFTNIGMPTASFSELHMETPVELGTDELLGDCSQHDLLKPCARLGWRVYTWIEPVSLTNSQIVVQASFMWADRGSTPLQEGVMPEGHAGLVGFSSKVYLVRTRTGGWKFLKVGVTDVA